MVEWYRTGDDMAAGIELLDALMQSLLSTPSAARTTYAEAFERALGISPYLASIDELAAAANKSGVVIPTGVSEHDRDEWLNLLLAARIELQLGRDRPEIIYHYPASQASLAKVVSSPHGYEVAERFELYYHGIELANGFHELADATELRRRFEAVNAARAAEDRPSLPLPERLLAAIEHGLPDCTGVALGFDRLAMLAMGRSRLTRSSLSTRNVRDGSDAVDYFSRATVLCRKHVTMWSLTMPTACMWAYMIVLPTNLKPRCLRSLLRASDSFDVALISFMLAMRF